jgi:hypothetical protein
VGDKDGMADGVALPVIRGDGENDRRKVADGDSDGARVGDGDDDGEGGGEAVPVEGIAVAGPAVYGAFAAGVTTIGPQPCSNRRKTQKTATVIRFITHPQKTNLCVHSAIMFSLYPDIYSIVYIIIM